jgi:thiol-disulfide isomerase/thioredoxin
MPYVLITLLSAFTFIGCGGSTSGGDASPAAVSDRTTYPEGPYGSTEGSVVMNHQMTNSDGEPYSLMDNIFADESTTLLLVSTGAEWCSACIEEQPILNAFYNEYKENGLRIVEVLFEDINFEPADVAIALNWKEANEVSYDVVADPDFSFEIYQDRSLTPLVMLIEVNTMTIIKMSSGFDESLYDALVRSKI